MIKVRQNIKVKQRIKAKDFQDLYSPSEKQIQSDFTKLIQPLQFNSIFAFHIDNGGTAVKGRILSKYRQGVVSGVPDYMVISLLTKSFIFIEFKSKKNGLSENQVKLHQKLKKHNIDVFVIRDAQDGFNLIQQHFNLKKYDTRNQEIPII